MLSNPRTGSHENAEPASRLPFFLRMTRWPRLLPDQAGLEPLASCQVLYDELLAALKQTWDQDGPRRDRAEDCFRLAVNHWDLLKKHYAGLFFANEPDEIRFFRFIKPGFLAFAQLFSLVYHEVLFRPHDPVACQSFLEAEALRFPNFLGSNRDLVSYWNSPDQSRDREFFLRRFHQPGQASRDAFDRDPLFFTAKDHLVRSYLALQAYHEYILEQQAPYSTAGR
ncbi:MAG TPA: RteC domain-containing protein [Chitinophagaceae bacterium]|nr:RteC domain-containing protein [Chitinophagaceae bacterium]